MNWLCNDHIYCLLTVTAKGSCVSMVFWQTSLPPDSREPTCVCLFKKPKAGKFYEQEEKGTGCSDSRGKALGAHDRLQVKCGIPPISRARSTTKSHIRAWFHTHVQCWTNWEQAVLEIPCPLSLWATAISYLLAVQGSSYTCSSWMVLLLIVLLCAQGLGHVLNRLAVGISESQDAITLWN